MSLCMYNHQRQFSASWFSGLPLADCMWNTFVWFSVFFCAWSHSLKLLKDDFFNVLVVEMSVWHLSHFYFLRRCNNVIKCVIAQILPSYVLRIALNQENIKIFLLRFAILFWCIKCWNSVVCSNPLITMHHKLNDKSKLVIYCSCDWNIWP